MAIDRATIANRMRTTVPRCIASFVCTSAARPEPRQNDDIAVWRISCKCGGQHGAFLGYPLRDFNTTYAGTEFIGPLGFACAKCEQITEVFDTDQHGYHAEACGMSSKICGEGPREKFACPTCAGTDFEVLTSFFFWPASIDLVEDEPEEFESRAQDLFCEFVAHGRCQACGALVRFTDFGKL